jgi:mono/diheme cytochrome c family protein
LYDNCRKRIYLKLILIILIVFHIIIFPIKLYSINPLSKDGESINFGANLYKNICSNCHGNNAEGKDNGFFLSPNLKVFSKGYDGFLNILKHGYGRMPAWGGKGKLSKNQLNQLAAYLEYISSEEANWK